MEVRNCKHYFLGHCHFYIGMCNDNPKCHIKRNMSYEKKETTTRATDL